MTTWISTTKLLNDVHPSGQPGGLPESSRGLSLRYPRTDDQSGYTPEGWQSGANALNRPFVPVSSMTTARHRPMPAPKPYPCSRNASGCAADFCARRGVRRAAYPLWMWKRLTTKSLRKKTRPTLRFYRMVTAKTHVGTAPECVRSAAWLGLLLLATGFTASAAETPPRDFITAHDGRLLEGGQPFRFIS